MSKEQLTKLVEPMRANPYRDDMSIESLREASERGGAAMPLPEGVRVESVSANGVPCEWINAPGVDSSRVFLFLHGGGYYRGSVAASRATAARFSQACGVNCLSVDYRLSPEHPYPAAVDDALSAFEWLAAKGFGSERVAVGGISAGGGLTLALLLRLKSLGRAQPSCAVPLSAWVDLTQSGETFESRAHLDPSISKAYLDRMAKLYARDHDAKTPEVSPLFGDLEGLPPMLLQVGTAEVLLDDSRAFAARAEAAGVAVELEVWDDMIHGWHGYAHALDEAQESIDRIGQFVNEKMPR